MSKINYFTDGNGGKFVVERTTETGFIVHKVQGVGETVSNSYEISYNDILADYKIDNVKFFPESIVTDLDGLFTLIKTLKRDAKLTRLENEEKFQKEEKERLERERIENEKKQEQDLIERRRKAKALRMKLELDSED